MRTGWYLATLPWFGQEREETRELMGENFWPYGIEVSKATLDALFQYPQEQGLARRRVALDEMFHPSALGLVES